MPSDADLKVFVQGTERFFERITQVKAKVGTPYVRGPEDDVIEDFSAVIGISGSQRGCIYVTASRDMLGELVKKLGETEFSDTLFADYIGEIANTIAGNAREHLGSRFMISPPVIFSAAGEKNVHFPPEIPAFVIPFSWDGHSAALILCLQPAEADTVAESESRIVWTLS